MNFILLGFEQKRILKTAELIKKCNLDTLLEKGVNKRFQDLTFKITIQP